MERLKVSNITTSSETFLVSYEVSFCCEEEFLPEPAEWLVKYMELTDKQVGCRLVSR